MSAYADLAVRFRAYHTNSLNVALHMITTPVGIVAALVMLRQAINVEYAYEALVGAYVISLFVALKNVGLWVATAAWMAGLVAVAEVLAPSFSNTDALKLMAVGYVGQELAHVVTGEKTFQSTYQFKTPSWPVLLLEHTYFLLPLCIDRARAHEGVARVLDHRAQLRGAVQAAQQGGQGGAADGG